MLGSDASRICGSADIYAKTGKCPACSTNFVTCHDGFTLLDLVSYRNNYNAAAVASMGCSNNSSRTRLA